MVGSFNLVVDDNTTCATCRGHIEPEGAQVVVPRGRGGPARFDKLSRVVITDFSVRPTNYAESDPQHVSGGRGRAPFATHRQSHGHQSYATWGHEVLFKPNPTGGLIDAVSTGPAQPAFCRDRA